MKIIKWNTHKWKDISYSWIRRLNIVKVDLWIQDDLYQNAFWLFFLEIDKLILKYIWKYKGRSIVRTILEEKKNASWDLMFLISKLTIKQQKLG